MIFNNPINAPHRLIGHLSAALFNYSFFSVRLASALFAIAFIFSFYKVVRHWFGGSIGIYGAILFALTPLLILAGRQAGAQIMFLAPAAIVAAYLWLNKSEKHKTEAWVALCLIAAVLIYTPGVLLWVLVAGIVSRRRLQAALSGISQKYVALGLLAGLVLVVPLIISIVKDWRVAQDLFLVPRHLPDTVRVFKNMAWMLLSVAVRAPRHYQLITGRLPMIDIAQTALMVFGAYALWTAARLKMLSFLTSILLAVVLAGINDNYYVLLLALPAISVFCAAGLRYLYIEWRGIFPNNPLPKALAITLIGAVVAAHVLYGVRYSLIAWPQTIETKTVYVVK